MYKDWYHDIQYMLNVYMKEKQHVHCVPWCQQHKQMQNYTQEKYLFEWRHPLMDFIIRYKLKQQKNLYLIRQVYASWVPTTVSNNAVRNSSSKGYPKMLCVVVIM